MGIPGKGRSRQESRDIGIFLTLIHILEYTPAMMTMRKKYRGTNRGPLKPYRRDVRMYREPPTYTRNAIVQSAPAVYRASARADRSWAPFGKSKTCKHRYSTFFSLNPGVGVSADRIFMANGMYDTDVSGTGHQPYGYDTLATQYNQWTVLRSKITVTVYNNQSGLLLWLQVLITHQMH